VLLHRMSNINTKNKPVVADNTGMSILKLNRTTRTGFEFVDAVVGGVVPDGLFQQLKKVSSKLCKRCLAGYEVVDLKVTIFDGTYHAVDSDEHSLRLPGQWLLERHYGSQTVLLEPINIIEVTVPENIWVM